MILDLTHTIREDMPVYPGSPQPAFKPTGNLTRNGYRETLIQFASHTGTHMRFNDTITAFPSILLALVCVTVFGSGKYQVLLVLGIVFIPSFARIARTAFSSLRDANFVQSARLMGATPARILFVHILPNTLHVLLPAVTIGFNNAVLAEASMRPCFSLFTVREMMAVWVEWKPERMPQATVMKKMGIKWFSPK